MEHRWGERIALDETVWLNCGVRGRAHGQIINISRSGALIRTPLALCRLSRVDFELHGRLMSSYVTRVAGSDIGVEWCGLPPEMFARGRPQRHRTGKDMPMANS